jgi:uncharacterized cupin superfamily protein
MAMKPLINIDDTDVMRTGHGERFEATHGFLSMPLGAEKIGASVTRVEPGKAAFPFHHHFGSEEHFFIVRGTGTLRCGAETYPVRPGDYIVHPPGGPDTAHQIINTGAETLVYLALGAMGTPDVIGYPDSRKTSVMTAPFGQEGLRFTVNDQTRDQAEYWDGEDGAQVEAVLKGLPT